MTATPLDVPALLRRLGLDPEAPNPGFYDGSFRAGEGGALEARSPAAGALLGTVAQATRADYDAAIETGLAAFERWRMAPAPARGEVVRRLGDALRARKDDLGALVSLEMGKIVSEGRGEVQEMIDIADFAVGLSRQLYGRSMHSERPRHRMYEQWHPLGTVAIISAFNFPVAVWAWNAFIALVCGDVCLWKPSEKTPLSAIAVCRIVDDVLAETGWRGVSNLVIGHVDEVGEPLLDDPRVPLVSATGSCRMGKIVGPRVAARLGRTLLELGGNNAVVVLDDADLDLVVRAVAFGAVGTAGQRCTTTRRLIVQTGVAQTLTERLVRAYGSITIGHPLEDGVLCGPLIDADAVAKPAGVGGGVNTIMQTCFFALSGVLQKDEAIAAIKASIEKSYGKKGEEVVRRNFRAVDAALAHLHPVPVPASPTSTRRRPPVVPPAAPDFVQRVTAAMLAGQGDLLPCSAFPPDGTWPTGTARWEKRAIARAVPVWDPAVCIQCNKCALMCPHAAIRAKVYEPTALAAAPDGFPSHEWRDKELPGRRYTIQVAPDDCTGCSLCVAVCPAKDKANPRHKAIDMTPVHDVRERERARFAFFADLPEVDPAGLAKLDVRSSQLLQPLFEFSGACAGCGETPYVKLLTQLFGDRLLIVALHDLEHPGHLLDGDRERGVEAFGGCGDGGGPVALGGREARTVDRHDRGLVARPGHRGAGEGVAVLVPHVPGEQPALAEEGEGHAARRDRERRRDRLFDDGRSAAAASGDEGGQAEREHRAQEARNGAAAAVPADGAGGGAGVGGHETSGGRGSRGAGPIARFIYSNTPRRASPHSPAEATQRAAPAAHPLRSRPGTKGVRPVSAAGRRPTAFPSCC